MNDILLVVVGSVLSIVASVVTALIAGRHERRRDALAAEQAAARQEAAWVEERVARKEEREVTAGIATHEMRLEVVLQLQEALQRTARLVGKAIQHDEKMARAGKLSRLPEELDEEMFNNSVVVAKLRERVLDEQLRGEVQYFRDQAVALTLNPQELYGDRTPDQVAQRSLEVLGQWGEAVERVMGHVGTAIRSEMAWRP